MIKNKSAFVFNGYLISVLFLMIHFFFVSSAEGSETPLLISESTRYYENNGMLSHLYSKSYKYDENHRLISKTINGRLINLIYNNSGLLVAEIGECTIDEKKMTCETRYAYNSNGLMTSKRNFFCSNDSGCYEYGTRYTYTYNANGNMLDETYWGHDTLIYKYTYTFDSSGMLIEKLYHNYRYSDDNLNKNIKFTYTYDKDDRETDVIDIRIKNGIWTNSYRTATFYNSEGQKMLCNKYSWYQANQEWNIYDRITYSHGSKGESLAENEESLLRGEWVKSSRTTYYYKSPAVVIMTESEGRMIERTGFHNLKSMDGYVNILGRFIGKYDSGNGKRAGTQLRIRINGKKSDTAIISKSTTLK